MVIVCKYIRNHKANKLQRETIGYLASLVVISI